MIFVKFAKKDIQETQELEIVQDSPPNADVIPRVQFDQTVQMDEIVFVK